MASPAVMSMTSEAIMAEFLVFKASAAPETQMAFFTIVAILEVMKPADPPVMSVSAVPLFTGLAMIVPINDLAMAVVRVK